MKTLLYILFPLFLVSNLWGQTHLEKAIFTLPDIIFEKISTPDGYSEAY